MTHTPYSTPVIMRAASSRFLRRFAFAGVMSAGIIFLAADPAAAQKPGAVAEVGHPVSGVVGISRTTGEIMADPAMSKTRAGIFLKREVEIEGFDTRPQNPAAPVVSHYPPSTARVSRKTPPTSPSIPQTTSTTFVGATLADTGAFPPDSMGAVGPSQFLVYVNGRLRTFNKTTGVADGVLNANPDTFFASVETPPTSSNFTSDPEVRFDRSTARWFLIIIDVPGGNGSTPNRVLIAVSDAASAGVISSSTVWTYYYVQQDTLGQSSSSGEFFDYPSLGVDGNALYIGGNMFSASAGSFTGCNGLVIRKSSVLNGGPIVATAFRHIATGTADGPYAPRGVTNYNSTVPEGYFIGSGTVNFGELVMRRVTDPGGTPAISANLVVTTPTTAAPIPVAHLGNTGGNNGRLDGLDDRLFAAQIRSGQLWTAHNVGVLPTGVAGGTTGTNGTKRDAVRWYQLNVPVGGTPTLVQSGTVFDSAANVSTARQYWMASVGISGQGHAALGFSTAGTTFHVDAATNGRLSGDALGTLGAPTIYTNSTTAYNPSSDTGAGNGSRRWGDYSYVSVDPNDDMTMWTIQEFCNATNTYAVQIVKLLAPPPATPSQANNSVAAGQSSVSVIITGTVVSGSGFFDPGTGFTNHLVASVTGGVTVNSATYTDPTHVTLDLNTSGATAGNQSVTITNPDGQAVTGTGILTVTQAVTTLSLASASSRKTHGSSGAFDINMPLTGTSGVEDRNGGGAYTLVFTFSNPVSAGNAAVTTGTGTVGGVTFSGTEMQVSLTGVTDQQVLTVTATNVSGPGTSVVNSVSVNLGVLIGDANADRFVDAGDTTQVRSHAGQTVDSTNFRFDLNVDGFIDAGDTTVVRARSGDSVP